MSLCPLSWGGDVSYDEDFNPTYNMPETCNRPAKWRCAECNAEHCHDHYNMTDHKCADCTEKSGDWVTPPSP